MIRVTKPVKSFFKYEMKIHRDELLDPHTSVFGDSQSLEKVFGETLKFGVKKDEHQNFESYLFLFGALMEFRYIKKCTLFAGLSLNNCLSDKIDLEYDGNNDIDPMYINDSETNRVHFPSDRGDGSLFDEDGFMNIVFGGYLIVEEFDFPITSDIFYVPSDGELPDYTITVGDDHIQVHKTILTAMSKVFEVAGNGKYKELDQFEVHGFSFDIVQTAVNFFRGEDITSAISIQECMELVRFADMYGVEPLMKVAQYRAMELATDVDRVVEIANAGTLYNATELVDFCIGRMIYLQHKGAIHIPNLCDEVWWTFNSFNVPLYVDDCFYYD